MCGIAGFLNPLPGADAVRLCDIARAMGDAIAHRGPDGHGEWADPAAGLALSHRRLAILDLTEAGFQPMHARSGRWVITFNGEIYNFAALRREVEAARGGFAWRGHSDTEILLEAFDEFGPQAALAKADGMFALAAWDTHERRLILARDRLGEKPLYWGRMPDGTLLFASELRALYAHPAWVGQLDPDAVTQLLRYQAICAPRSIYRNLHKLPPAHWLEVRAGQMGAPQPYWDVETMLRAGETEPEAALDVWTDRLESVLGDVVEEQMVSDVPLGAFLSGGIDSSLVVAMMQKRASRPVKTFTIGFGEDSFDEARFAREVARHLGTEHHELTLSGQDALALVPSLPDAYDEPFADSSQLPTSLVARFAREHVTVALSGDGGDESFAGYSRYGIGDGLWQRVSRVPRPWRVLGAAGLQAVPGAVWDGVIGALGARAPAHLRASPREKVQRIARILRGRSPVDFYDELVGHWGSPETVVRGGRLEVPARARALAATRSRDVEYMQVHDTFNYLPDVILVKVDRAAMHVSLETRAPLIDRRVVEFAWRLPFACKMQGDKGKIILKHLLARHVPRELFERPKQGFGIPLAAWLRGPLRPWAESLLTPTALAASGLFNPQPILRKWREHQAGQCDWHYHLWDILMFQAWFERYRAHVA